jgi:hypothetical protein
MENGEAHEIHAWAHFTTGKLQRRKRFVVNFGVNKLAFNACAT